MLRRDRHLSSLKVLAIWLGLLCVFAPAVWGQATPTDSPQLPPGGLPVPPPIPEAIRNNPPTPPANLPDASALMEQLRMMEQLLQLTPDQLLRLRQALEVIEKMSEQDRVVMRQRLQQMRTVSQKSDSQLRWVVTQVPSQQRRNATQFWLSLTEDSRNKLWQEWQQIPEDQQRTEVLKAVQDFVLKREEQARYLQTR